MTLALLVKAFAVIGIAFVLRGAINTVDFCRQHFFLPSQPLCRYRNSVPDSSHQTSYALITGSSAGIGLGIAISLIKHGFGVILLSRSEEKLFAAAKMLRALKVDAEVKTVAMDGTIATPTEINSMVEGFKSQGLNITVLVNNLGATPGDPPPIRPFRTFSETDIEQYLAVNCGFITHLTARMLPLLEKSASACNSRALIINTSSAGKISLPYMTAYSAVKAYILAMSLSISQELEFPGPDKKSDSVVDCIAIAPADVESEWNRKGVAASLMVPTWDAYGECVVRTVDKAVQLGWRSISPYWLHDLQLMVLEWLPEGARTEGLGKMIWIKKLAWEEFCAARGT